VIGVFMEIEVVDKRPRGGKRKEEVEAFSFLKLEFY